MSIEQRGGAFRVRVTRAGRSTSGTFPSLEDARAFEAAWVAAVTGGREAPTPPRPAPVVEAPAPVTVETAARELVRGMASGAIRDGRGRVYKPATTRAIESRLRRNVLPRVGAIPVTVLRRGDVRMMVDEITGDVSAASAGEALAALGLVLRLMVDRDVIEVNVTHGVRRPACDRRPKRILTRDEARTLQDTADADQNPSIGPFIALALATGLRRGELRALRWGDLDLTGGVVHVTGTEDPLAGRVATKNRDERSVPLGPAVVARLRRWRLASPRSGDADRILAHREDEPWERVRKAAGLADPQPTIHDLRRTAASFWATAGLHAHEVAVLLGHRDGGTLASEVYIRAMPERIAGAGALIEGFMAG